MTSEQDKNHHNNNEDKNHQKHDEKNSQDTTKDSFLGIRFSEEVPKVENNLFGLPTYIEPENNQSLNNSSPAFTNLLNQIEGAVRANRIDEQTIDLFRQISQLSNIDNIIKSSTILNASLIATIREKERATNTEVNSQTATKNVTENAPKIDDIQLRLMQAEFLESRQNYRESLEDKSKDIALPSIDNTGKDNHNI